MKLIPDSTKSSLQQRLNQRRRERWPQLEAVKVRFRALASPTWTGCVGRRRVAALPASLRGLRE